MSTRSSHVAGLFVALLVATSVHAADPSSPPPVSETARAEASTRFGRGVQLFEAQDYAAALAEFEAAHRLVPRFAVLFNVGVTQKRLFRYDEAIRTLQRYLAEGGDKVAPDRRQEVERELGEMRALVAEVAVRVDGLPARLEVDGRFVAETPLGRPLLLAPGRHVLRALREDCDPAERAIELVSSQRVEVRRDPQPRQVAPTRGVLKLSTVPTGATLLLDGKSLGLAPWTGSVQPGGHELRVEQAGHVAARREVVITAGQERSLVIELQRVPPPKPIYKRWYLWTAIAVVAAGVVAAGVGGWYANRSQITELRYPGP